MCKRLAILQLSLALVTPVLGISYPATIEIDLLFPRNETYNNMTGFPIVFALQNADAAGTFGWDFDWQFTRLDGDGNNKFLDFYTGSLLDDSPTSNDFRYQTDDILIVPGKIYSENNYYIRPGTYSVSWRYYTSTCTKTNGTTYINDQTMAAHANSTVIFTVVADGSGLDFEIPADECPVYSGQWTAESGTSSDCPVRDLEVLEPSDPCKAQLSKKQLSCLQNWFAGNNGSHVCHSSLKQWDVLRESAAASLVPGVPYLLFSALLGMIVESI
ncbi:uncharacterized protein DSM5745_03019 [Aspergillus mulundensis]|uniref:DUF7136 domain-containing protein n=1 Tax=Aspergillus mulundensis TaxID=1810919 RepID=A0A3D8SJ75_9EURO|nr:Uncharacterized protein DSM5745_03019 [Aspergillus mulundensis]RDW86377.1 Uncharacterized protein DSM5745_03019 [Aspergillus mulundensis]